MSDFISPARHDVIALTCVSAGSKFSQYEKELYDAGNYQEYFFVHGLGVELAEALADHLSGYLDRREGQENETV